MSATIRIDRGVLEIPADLREQLGWNDGTELVAIADDGELRLAPTGLPEPEIYTPERKAEFLLSNAASEQDYLWALDEVRRMGLDPEMIEHYRPERWAR